MRHIETQYLFVQSAVKKGVLKVKKIDGKKNPSNALTKHLKSGPEHQDARLGLGLVDSSQLSLQEYTKLKVAQAKRKPWYPGSKLVFSAVMASQLLQLVNSENVSESEMQIATVESRSLATWSSTELSWSTIAFGMLMLYLAAHVVADLFRLMAFLKRCKANCSKDCSLCCRRKAVQPEDGDELLTTVKTTAKGEKAHIHASCPILKQSSVHVTNDTPICKHCRRLTLESILDKKKNK